MHDPTGNVVGRDVQMQHPLDRMIYHPLAAQLAKVLSRSFVTPNMVSVAGGLAIILAGLFYVQPGWPLTAIVGFAIHCCWHVLDGADGDLARLTGRSSPTGEIVDGICDYAGHIVLYLLLAATAFSAVGWIAWVLVVAAGASRVVQANFHEVQRRRYQSWTAGRHWIGSGEPGSQGGVMASLANGYLRLAQKTVPPQPAIDAAAADPARSAQIAAALRAVGHKRITGSDLLGANPRTLALGASMLAGSPLYFFLFEAVVLNLVLFRDVRVSKRALDEVAAQLAPSTLR